MNINKNKPIEEGENHLPLQADADIEPLAEDNQLPKRMINKTRFLRDIKRLNDKSRGMDTKMNDEKMRILSGVNYVSRLKIRDSTGKEKKLPSDIRKILSLLREYSVTNGTASENSQDRGYSFFGILWWAFKVTFNVGGSRRRIKNEHKSLANALEKLNEVIEKYSGQEEYKEVLDELRSAQNMLLQRSGGVSKEAKTPEEKRKAKWKDYKADSKHIDGLGKSIETTADVKKKERDMKFVLETNVVRDRSDWPLFAHRPSHKDIIQGASGNCYFLAALASIPAEKIRNMMLDNGDGTVTVRFYERDSVTQKHKPVYVTVDKKVKINGALDCLWVQVMEKAYALFKQNHFKNELSFSEKTEKDPTTGEMVRAKNKTIAENVIDLGFVANGGESGKVLEDMLGTKGENIKVSALKDEKTIGHLYLEALYRSTKKGRAFLEIEKTEDQIRMKLQRLNKQIAARDLQVKDLFSYNKRIEDFDEAIKFIDENIQHDNIDYNAVMNRAKMNKKVFEDRFLPLRGLMADYKTAREKATEKIKQLKKISGLPDEYELIDDVYFIRKEGNHMEPVAFDIFGFEDELGVLKDKYKQKLETTIQMPEFVESQVKALLSTVTNFVREFLNYEEEHLGSLEDKPMSAHMDFLDKVDKDLKGDAKALKTFMKSTKFTNNLLIGNVQDEQDEQDEQVKEQFFSDLLKEFLRSLIPKMKKCIPDSKDLQQDDRIGDEDEDASEFFEQISNMLGQGQCVCVGTKDMSNRGGDDVGMAGEEVLNGIVGTHAYTVMDTKITNDGVKLVQLRNPWGAYVQEYRTGKTGKLEKYSVKSESDGVFWIEMNQFMKNIDMIYGSGMPDVNVNEAEQQ